ncbi:SCO2400 family protein [Streptomyces humicola]|uniref:SCO2400 family protein n=1 Tax=Streptomyces humicola TaxID=2953240 RepID=UPI003FD875BB
MDYCPTCRRHLNGALCCPGCGAFVGTGLVTDTTMPQAVADHYPHYPGDLLREEFTAPAPFDVPVAGATPPGPAGRRRRRARKKNSRRRAVAVTAMALLGGGLTAAALPNGLTSGSARAASMPDLADPEVTAAQNPIALASAETNTPVATPASPHAAAGGSRQPYMPGTSSPTATADAQPDATAGGPTTTQARTHSPRAETGRPAGRQIHPPSGYPTHDTSPPSPAPTSTSTGDPGAGASESPAPSPTPRGDQSAAPRHAAGHHEGRREHGRMHSGGE